MIVPGPLVLLGSGETAPNMQRVYSWLLGHFVAPVRVAVLETPAGFEPNSPAVAATLRTYLERHLVNFRPQVEVVAARRADGEHSTNKAELLAPLAASDLIAAGPGSPTYAVRHLRDSLAWQMMRAHHRMGGGLLFSSAGTLAVGSTTLPVYEIYKVGLDLHWTPGLNLLCDYGLELLFVSHWNNTDGGSALDTSRCYMGAERFERLQALLPPSPMRTLVGIEEKTALCVDFARASCTVLGAGGVVVQRGGRTHHHARGSTFALHELGELRLPAGGEGLPEAVWQELAEARARRFSSAAPAVPAEVEKLVAQREAARSARDWAESDRLRAAVNALGWQVKDTADGPLLEHNEQL